MSREEELEHALGVLTFHCIGRFVDADGTPTGGVHLPGYDAVIEAFNALDKHGNNIRAGLLSASGKPFAHVQRPPVEYGPPETVSDRELKLLRTENVRLRDAIDDAHTVLEELFRGKHHPVWSLIRKLRRLLDAKVKS